MNSKILNKNSLKWFLVYSFILEKSKELDKQIPEIYRQEMKWISIWAWVSYNDILLINVYDDLLNLKWCSSFIVWKSEKSDYLIHARNLDYPIDFLASKKVIFNYLDEKFISVSFPWYIWALSATNSNWITISTHTSSSKYKNIIWLPIWIIYRKIIQESKNILEVENIIKNSSRTISNNLAVSSLNENKMIVFELTSQNYISRIWEKYIVSTNHFESKEFTSSISKNSKWRYDYLENSFIKNNKLDSEKIKQIMSFYDWNSESWSSVANKWTVQSVIFVPEKRILFIADWLKTPVTTSWYLEYNYNIN